ncbi:cation:proton antiporter [Serinibacter salmoneus]|uniref:Sodium/proton antiporter (CPA1 family) n=1 Tax=Serinibacter salmoneus TaxID=556530 RepID=A0A2A9D5S4_9MICO|nr:sodium:proton antiporter [Serinibacter salmoneus]PFG21312.1 sodium/proton antiporter (CPA1 family) [Serinibacter salmoneus]
MSPLVLASGAVGIILLATALARRTGVATPLILVLIGAIISLMPAIPDIELQPEWILMGVLPPLLYASAVQVPVIDLRRNVGMIGWLSIVLVIVSAFGVGALVHLLLPSVPFAAGVALGAVISPTDAVAATAVGKRLGLPPRVMAVLEGESLFNDASALVMLKVATVAAAGGFSFLQLTGDFAYGVVIAVALGLAIGWVSVLVRERISDPVLSTSVSLVLPWLVYWPAEELGASGVVAVVVAGVLSGHLGLRRLSAQQRQIERTNWATIAFLLENAVFLLMGLQLVDLFLDVTRNQSSVGLVVGVAAACVLALVLLRVAAVAVFMRGARWRAPHRARRLAAVDAAVKGLDDSDPQRAKARRRLARLRADREFYRRAPITRKGGLVISWAGMRGVVTVAAALTLPVSTPMRSTLIAVAFTVALMTLLGFGLTLPWVIRRTGLGQDPSQSLHGEVVLVMRDVHRQAVSTLREDGDLDEEVVSGLAERLERIAKRDGLLARTLGAGPQEVDPETGEPVDPIRLAAVRYFDAAREALADERSLGAYSTEAIAQVQEVLDLEELRRTR